MNEIKVEYGTYDGEVCNRDNCKGVIDLYPPINCSCHINPPCPACTNPQFYCPECGWEEANE